MRPARRPQRGQAVVESVAWAALVAALCVALSAALHRARVPQQLTAAISHALGDAEPRPTGLASVTPRTRAVVLAAVHGSPDGHAATIGDAERLLAAELGPDAARAELARLAVADFLTTHGRHLEGVKEVVAFGSSSRLRAEFGGIGPPSSARWHGRQERRTDAIATAHVVTAAAARRLRDALHRRHTRELRRDEVVKLVVEAGLTYLVPWLRVPLFAAQFIEALRAAPRPSTFPPGLRADDVVLCYPVRRLNLLAGAVDRRRWGAGPDALDAGVWHDMTHLVTVRSGAIVGEAMSDAATCS